MSGDTVAVDHQALIEWLDSVAAAIEAIPCRIEFGEAGHEIEWVNRGEVLAAIGDPDSACLAALLAYARAEERHTHGVRIANDHEEQASAYERLGYYGEDIYLSCAQRARDLSPAPEDRALKAREDEGEGEG